MNSFKKLFSIERGYIYLKLCILLIQVLPLISALLALISSSIGFFKTRDKFFKDKYNYPFLISGFLMILSSMVNNTYNKDFLINNNLNTWLGLFNWIPYFYVFWGLQYFLKTEKARKESLYCFLIGSIPILLSGLGQYFLNLNGPFKTFFGLIVIFQRPLCLYMNESEIISINGECASGLTSFFNNPNYYSIYLLMILPLAFSILIYTLKKMNIINFLPLSLTLVILFSLFLTYSRNGLIGSFITIKLFIDNVLKLSSFKKLVSTIFFILILFLIYFLIVQDVSGTIPDQLKNKFSQLNFSNILESPRIKIWTKTLDFIKESPIFGWGANSFQYFYNLDSISFQHHPHNLILDIALNYGLTSALLIYINFSIISLKSLSYSQRIIVTKDYERFITDLGWSISALVVSFSYLFDVTYYDYKIAISFWIILAGSKCIYSNNLLKKHLNPF